MVDMIFLFHLFFTHLKFYSFIFWRWDATWGFEDDEILSIFGRRGKY